MNFKDLLNETLVNQKSVAWGVDNLVIRLAWYKKGECCRYVYMYRTSLLELLVS